MKKDFLEMSETEFKTAIKRFLDAHNILHIPYAASRFSKKGIPDTYIILNGISIWIEFKKENKPPTKLQRHKIDELNDHGAISFVLDRPDAKLFKKLFMELMRTSIDSYEYYQIREKLIEIGKDA